MEMKYLRVPTAESSLPPDESPRHSSSVGVKRAVRWLNSYVQITSPAYQHGKPERKLSLIIFLVFFVCFVFSMLFIFSAGDMCASHSQGLERLRMERDQLKAEIIELRGQLESSTTTPAIAANVEHVIP